MNIQKLILLGVVSLFIVKVSNGEKYVGTPENNSKSVKSVAAGCAPGSGSTYLELNNVRALIHTGGDMWWDLQGKAKYEVPKGSGKTALFAGAIWIGGTDLNGQLKLAALKFRSEGLDYWPGPLITSGEQQASVTPEICAQFDKHFSMNRNDVAKFRSWYNADAATRAAEFAGYTPPSSIESWPAHGPAGGYDYYLAPFYDNNNDGAYNSSDGDYPFYDLDNSLPCGTSRELRKPRLYGDQTLWWVYNDKGNIHTETGGDAIGFEIRAQAFAFATNDELNNMTFYNYELINRSTYTLKETYFGVWTDADMGYAQDDYVGCDVSRGLGYLYNGKAVDGTGQPEAYGGPNPPPPAIGIDFFEGPYQDADGVDNLSNWNCDGILDCQKGFVHPHDAPCAEVGTADFMNGNINGLNFGDGIVDNERWGMRRFIYFNNCSANDICDPVTAAQFYNYLRGYWKDGTSLFYGGTGHLSSTQKSDFMFPGLTDVCNWGLQGNTPAINYPTGWTEVAVGNQAGDRRLCQSAGPFTLEPGAVNDITTGAVWARATSGTPYESVTAVQLADDKAQKLFENCFKVVDGPDAPDMEVIEMDKRLIFHLFNKIGSNNYMEAYHQKDPFIVCPANNPSCDQFYTFQGYQVFQLKDKNTSVSELHDISKARLIFQCDKKDGISKIVNYTWSDDLGANIPVLEVNGDNNGIRHSFEITEDMFATSDKRLVNNRKYYFVAIAYAHNDYLHYDQNDAATVNGQKAPYKAGRKGAGGAISVYEVIPHNNSVENGGTVIQGDYGAGVKITQIEGHGNGNNNLDLTEETVNQIMTSQNWKANKPVYANGRGPIDVKIIDPLHIPDGTFTLKFDSVSFYDQYPETSKNYGLIKDAKWSISNGTETINSDNWITYNDEKIIAQWGISIRIEQVGFPLSTGDILNLGPVYNNGLIESTYSMSNSKLWLSGFPDIDGATPYNWIRSGTQTDPTLDATQDYELNTNDYQISGKWADPDQVYEKMIGGTWAPYRLSSKFINGPAYGNSFSVYDITKTGFNSVDVYLTADKSKWTRCPVIEMSEDPVLAVGGAAKFDLRRSPSVDKNGVPCAVGSGSSTNPDDPNYIGEMGMGWFPGYAIDVETGERLNMMFAEDSRLVGDNGADMIWNPSPNWQAPLGDYLLGGKHFVYVLGHTVYNSTVPMPNYDAGAFAYSYMSNYSASTYANKKRDILSTPMWVYFPRLENDYVKEFKDNKYVPLSEIKVRLRVAKPYRKGHKDWAVASPVNSNFPTYEFSTSDVKTRTGDLGVAESALDLIGVVPNPYYGYNAYEQTQTENLVKIINLPRKCTVSIYTVNGTLVRKFGKDNESTIVEWDLKNTYGINVSSGLYIIHIDAPGIGEKVVKWFGAMRPIDLNAF